MRTTPLCPILQEHLSCFTPEEIEKIKRMEPKDKLYARTKSKFGRLLDRVDRDIDRKI